jgi:hypothetical protein
VSTNKKSATSIPQPKSGAEQGSPNQNGETRDTCRESESSLTPGEIRAAYLELNRQITVKLDAYVAQAVKAKTDFDALVPLLDLMQSMLSQRGSRRRLMDTLGLPTWTEWFTEFRPRLHEEITLRTIQRKLRQYRDDSDPIGEADPSDPEQVGKTSERVEPGSREDRARPIWFDQAITVRYNPEHGRMEGQAEYIERQKRVGLVGNRTKDRILAHVTVWQAVYAEPGSEVDKPALAKVVLGKVVNAANDTDYFDITALKKEAAKLAEAVKP